MSERMNPAVKAKWLAALRSGKYKQGTGTLRDEFDNFCCLGVLCDVAVKSGLAIDVKPPRETCDPWAYEGEAWYRPPQVMDWAGLINHDPKIADEGHEHLSALNDDAEMNFLEIADVIEEEL